MGQKDQVYISKNRIKTRMFLTFHTPFEGFFLRHENTFGELYIVKKKKTPHKMSKNVLFLNQPYIYDVNTQFQDLCQITVPCCVNQKKIRCMLKYMWNYVPMRFSV